MPRRVLFLLVFLPLLAACSAPYHPLRGGVGFSELPIGPDNFQITYAGAPDMGIGEARRYAYLRAAELAAGHDTPYFQLVAEHIYVSWGMHYYPGTDFGYVGGYGYHRAYYRRYYESGYVEPYSLPNVVLQVQLFPSPGPTTIPAAYLLRQAVEDKIKLSPGVVEKLPTLPDATTPVALPPPPQPTTRPADVPPP